MWDSWSHLWQHIQKEEHVNTMKRVALLPVACALLAATLLVRTLDPAQPAHEAYSNVRTLPASTLRPGPLADGDYKLSILGGPENCILESDGITDFLGHISTAEETVTVLP
jgi:hypothetical protein